MPSIQNILDAGSGRQVSLSLARVPVPAPYIAEVIRLNICFGRDLSERIEIDVELPDLAKALTGQDVVPARLHHRTGAPKEQQNATAEVAVPPAPDPSR